MKRKLEWAEQGLAVNFGYLRPSWVDFIGNTKQPGEHRLNEQAKLIRRIVDMALAGRSQNEIAKTLIGERVPTLRGGQWSRSLIAHILHTQLLVGTATICGKTLDHYYPPIITNDEWERLQVLRGQNLNRFSSGRPHRQTPQAASNFSRCARLGGICRARPGFA